MILDYFSDLIKLAPQMAFDSHSFSWGGVADKAQEEKVRDGLQTEASRFFCDLSGKQPPFITPIIEEVTGNLLHAYYLTRKAMSKLDEEQRDEGRPSMNLLYEAIVMVMSGANRLGLKYSNEFVTGWQKRTSYFPFVDIIPFEKNIRNASYDGIGKDLLKYIDTANDEVLCSIILKKEVPDGLKKPRWIGGEADAHRFRVWCSTTEAIMRKCFFGLDSIKRGNSKGIIIELADSIWSKLEKYPRPTEK